MYKCISCKREVDKIEDRIRCPYCGHRILSKMRAENVVRVVAR